jgi:IclR family pca regulon transcriptional regulator
MDLNESNSHEKDRSFIGSLERGLRVIQAFGSENAVLSVSETASRAGISRAAARRFLRTLEHLGYMGCDDSQRYYLKPKVLSLGYTYLASLRLDQLALKPLTVVMEKSGMSCSMGVLSNTEVVYIARVEKPKPLHISIRVGERLPAFSTALGRVLLSGRTENEVRKLLAKTELRKFTDDTIIDAESLINIINDIRRQDWAYVVNQQMPGWTSVAVPVRNAQREIVAAINASAQYQPSPNALVDLTLPLLRAAAAEIEWAIKSTHTALAYP